MSESNSFFLFGPRGTGKSTLLREKFPAPRALWFDLLDSDEEDRLNRRPMELSERLTEAAARDPSLKWCVIDEIQKIPRLLDVVHSEIEKRRFLFALTGSSARKLKRGGANLLAGRAFVHSMHPLTHVELGDAFDLDTVLRWGSLPRVLSLDGDEERARYLRSYAQTYVKEEIQAEQIVRKIEPFRAFLEVAAQSNGRIVSYSSIASDIASDATSVRSYFQILEDTLLGFFLPPHHRSIRKRQRKNPKFYFFDLGVARALERALGLPLPPRISAYGVAFEHFVILEIHRLSGLLERDWTMSYLRTKDDVEIDLILDRPGMPSALIEIKSAERVDERATRSLERIGRDFRKKEMFCFSLDPVPKRIGAVRCLHWRDGMRELGLTGFDFVP